MVGTGGSGGLGYAHAMLVDGEEARPGKYDVVARYRGSQAPDHARVGVLSAALTTANPQVRFTLGAAPRAASGRGTARPTAHSGHSAPSLPATGSAALPAILAAAPALVALRRHRATR